MWRQKDNVKVLALFPLWVIAQDPIVGLSSGFSCGTELRLSLWVLVQVLLQVLFQVSIVGLRSGFPCGF